MIKTKVKKWGNSIGIIIPKETIESLNLKLGDSIIVDFRKKENVLKELFGSLEFEKPKEILKEVREELEGKWLK